MSSSTIHGSAKKGFGVPPPPPSSANSVSVSLKRLYNGDNAPGVPPYARNVRPKQYNKSNRLLLNVLTFPPPPLICYSKHLRNRVQPPPSSSIVRKSTIPKPFPAYDVEDLNDFYSNRKSNDLLSPFSMEALSRRSSSTSIDSAIYKSIPTPAEANHYGKLNNNHQYSAKGNNEVVGFKQHLYTIHRQQQQQQQQQQQVKANKGFTYKSVIRMNYNPAPEYRKPQPNNINQQHHHPARNRPSIDSTNTNRKFVSRVDTPRPSSPQQTDTNNNNNTNNTNKQDTKQTPPANPDTDNSNLNVGKRPNFRTNGIKDMNFSNLNYVKERLLQRISDKRKHDKKYRRIISKADQQEKDTFKACGLKDDHNNHGDVSSVSSFSSSVSL